MRRSGGGGGAASEVGGYLGSSWQRRGFQSEMSLDGQPGRKVYLHSVYVLFVGSTGYNP